MATTWTSAFWSAFRRTIRPIRPKLISPSACVSRARTQCSPVNSDVDRHICRVRSCGLRQESLESPTNHRSSFQVQLAHRSPPPALLLPPPTLSRFVACKFTLSSKLLRSRLHDPISADFHSLSPALLSSFVTSLVVQRSIISTHKDPKTNFPCTIVALTFVSRISPSTPASPPAIRRLFRSTIS